MMTKPTSLLLLISVLVLGIFSFTSMSHGADYSVGCIASIVSNTSCPENIVEISVHHIQAFVSFFSAVPSVSLISLLALLFTLFLSAGFFLKQRKDFGIIYPELRQYRRDPERFIVRPRRITRWLSLFENSPSLHRIVFITNFNLINLCKQKNTKTINITNSLIRKLHLILSVEWSLMQRVLRHVQTTKVRLTTFALFTARITLQPIRLSIPVNKLLY